MNEIKKMISIKVGSAVEEREVLLSMHNQLVGNQDYIDSNIVLNDSSTRADGTKHEVRVYIFDGVREMPIIQV